MIDECMHGWFRRNALNSRLTCAAVHGSEMLLAPASISFCCAALFVLFSLYVSVFSEKKCM